MKKLGIGILIGVTAFILIAAGIGNFKYIDFETVTDTGTYYNRLSSGKSDSLYFRDSDETTEHLLYPNKAFSGGYVPYTGANFTLNLNTQTLRQYDDAYHYFGTSDNVRQYFDGTNFHVEPANYVSNPDTLQILFSNPDTIFTADGDIKDWSGNGYDAELSGSYQLKDMVTAGDYYDSDINQFTALDTANY